METDNQQAINTPLISVIVAIYNVEAYLKTCIDSILAQTYRNIELILVNDGSTDNSLAICHEYANRDKRVKVIDKPNQGQATARNAALDIAQGEYIGFVDGDDWIEPRMYQFLLNELQKTQSDIVQCGWYIATSTSSKTLKNTDKYTEHYTSAQALDELIVPAGGHLNTSVCCKLFSSTLAQQFRFIPVRAYEDDDFIFKVCANAKKITCIDTPLYNYLNRQGSTMTSSFNLNKLALVTVQSSICALIKDKHPAMFHKTQKTLCSKQFYMLACLTKNKHLPLASLHFKQIHHQIMAQYDEYMLNPEMGRNRMMLRAMKLTPKFVWKTLLRLKFS